MTPNVWNIILPPSNGEKQNSALGPNPCEFPAGFLGVLVMPAVRMRELELVPREALSSSPAPDGCALTRT